jgi:hypothetical protein
VEAQQGRSIGEHSLSGKHAKPVRLKQKDALTLNFLKRERIPIKISILASFIRDKLA